MNTIIRSTDQIQCSNYQAGHGGGDSRVGGSWGGVSMGILYLVSCILYLVS